MNDSIGSGLRAMAESDLARVLAWRNHPDVRRYMYTQQEITPQAHHAWFERVAQDRAKRVLIYEEQGVALGLVNLRLFAGDTIAEWGFYAAPEALRGTGRRLGAAALQHVFGTLGLHKVCGEALAWNERSIGFHRTFGFREEGTLRDQHFDGQHYHDVICFGLLRHEWQARL